MSGRKDKNGKLTLVIMAAGMGSRYGGLKQIEPIDRNGHIIMDFSICDALKAGFEKVVFVIKKENESDFQEVIGGRIAKQCETAYAFQDVADLPDGYTLPEGRVKPWGTGHALLCAADVVDGPCAVINADDYYGPEAFKLAADYLKRSESAGPDLAEGSSEEDSAAEDRDSGAPYRFMMAGFLLKNTLTENGYVSRGVCEVDEDGYLADVTERVRIEKRPPEGLPAFTEDSGLTWTALDENTVVSMNMWGFTPEIFDELKARFPVFLDTALKTNPLKAEYYLPAAVDALIKEKKATVRVLTSHDQWYGVTYHEDREKVCAALIAKEESGQYQF